LIIAQLTDIHIGAEEGKGGEPWPVRSLRAAVAGILGLRARPDCVVLTGDLTDHGRPEEYVRLRELLAPLPMPVHPIPGNHDDRDALRTAFGAHPAIPPRGPVQYAVDLGEARLVCCDSTVPGKPHGQLDAERLDWLDATLARAPRKDTIVAVHHPPFPIGIRFIDGMALHEPENLGALLRKHPQVTRVISGHVHRAAMSAFAGTVAVTCPSIHRQLLLDLTRPGSGAITAETSGFALHVVKPGSTVSHFVPVGEFPPVVEFD
jgi:Icc protein